MKMIEPFLPHGQIWSSCLAREKGRMNTNKKSALAELRGVLRSLSPEAACVLAFADKKYPAIVNAGTLLLKIGSQDLSGTPIIWKIPYEDWRWVLATLPVFPKRLKDTELVEAKHLRILRARMARNSWHLTPAYREELQQQIVDAEEMLERAKARPILPRYSVAKTGVCGDEVQVHHLYIAYKNGVNESDVTEVGSWSNDFLDYTSLFQRVSVVRNFGLMPAQENSPALAEAEDGKSVPNLYLKSLYGTSAPDQQAAFNRSMQRLPEPEHEGAKIPVQPNADLCTRVGTPHGIVDAGKFAPLGVEEGSPWDESPVSRSAAWRRADIELDRLLKNNSAE
jgi:hypothetical protein